MRCEPGFFSGSIPSMSCSAQEKPRGGAYAAKPGGPVPPAPAAAKEAAAPKDTAVLKSPKKETKTASAKAAAKE